MLQAASASCGSGAGSGTAGGVKLSAVVVLVCGSSIVGSGAGAAAGRADSSAAGAVSKLPALPQQPARMQSLLAAQGLTLPLHSVRHLLLESAVASGLLPARQIHRKQEHLKMHSAGRMVALLEALFSGD